MRPTLPRTVAPAFGVGLSLCAVSARAEVPSRIELLTRGEVVDAGAVGQSRSLGQLVKLKEEYFRVLPGAKGDSLVFPATAPSELARIKRPGGGVVDMVGGDDDTPIRFGDGSIVRDGPILLRGGDDDVEPWRGGTGSALASPGIPRRRVTPAELELALGWAKRDAVVMLLYSAKAKEKGLGVCTGTLVSRTFVLTAAHCVREVPSAIAIGADFGGQVTREVGDCHMHPSAVKSKPDEERSKCGGFAKEDAELIPASHDLALLRLKDSVDPTLATPRPVLLSVDASAGSLMVATSALLPKDMLVRLVGYGSTACGDRFVPPSRRQQGPARIGGLADTGALLLAGTSDVALAGGDSGGPVYVESKGPWRREVLIGVSARSECKASFYAAPTFAPKNADWLRKILEDGSSKRWKGEEDRSDNCPDFPNPDQEDSDGDKQGDACQCQSTAVQPCLPKLTVSQGDSLRSPLAPRLHP